jgi:hypothetical protein
MELTQRLTPAIILLFFIIVLGVSLTPSITFASEMDYPETNKEDENRLIFTINSKLHNHYAFDRCRALQAKPFDNKSNKKKLIIIGDSQGCDFLNGMLENGYLTQYQIQFRFIPYACQRVPNEDIQRYISPKHQAFCLKTKRVDNLEKVKQDIGDADLVIFSALWKASVAAKMPKIFRYLNIKPQQRLIVIGYKFFGKISAQKYANLSNPQRRLIRNKVGSQALKINAILEKTLGNQAVFINPHQLICGNTTSCPVFTGALELISYDGRHLTKAGARYITKILFQKTKLGSI